MFNLLHTIFLFNEAESENKLDKLVFQNSWLFEISAIFNTFSRKGKETILFIMFLLNKINLHDDCYEFTAKGVMLGFHTQQILPLTSTHTLLYLDWLLTYHFESKHVKITYYWEIGPIHILIVNYLIALFIYL